MQNHTITVKNRKITVDNPKLVKGCVKSDTITLNLDEEWKGRRIIVTIGKDENKKSALWENKPMVIDVDFPEGYVSAMIVGESSEDGSVIITNQASHAFRVKKGKN